METLRQSGLKLHACLSEHICWWLLYICIAQSHNSILSAYKCWDDSKTSVSTTERLTPNLYNACSFLWTIQYLVGAGFYVIPAYQPADHSVDNTVVSTPAIFLRNWANLWAAISELPNFDTS